MALDILIKYPTRGRPTQFLQTLSGWMSLADDLNHIRVLVSCDSDDLMMTDQVIVDAGKICPNLTVVRSSSPHKIAACNADLPSYQEKWDIVLLVSDDMFCTQIGWDNFIRENMELSFPNLNGALWFFDGAQKAFNTLECVGRKRYAHFGYLYHPAYAGFFCDNESTEVGLRDGKLKYVDLSICRHEHPLWKGSMKNDATYSRSLPWWNQDSDTYQNRKSAGFPKEF